MSSLRPDFPPADQDLSLRLWRFMLQEGHRFRASRFRREFGSLEAGLRRQAAQTALQLLWRSRLIPVGRPPRSRALSLRRAWATMAGGEFLPPPPDTALPEELLRRRREWQSSGDRECLAREPWSRLACPRWLYRHLCGRLGEESTVALLRASNLLPPQYLRVLPGQNSERLAEELRAAGLPLAIPGAGFLRLDFSALEIDLEALSPVRAGRALVGGPSAAVIAEWLPEDGRILDLCAAPGGKSLAIRAGGGPSRILIAGDRTWSRVKKLRRGQERLSSPCSWQLLVHDGCAPPYRPDSFAAVVLDAPCSGSGILRRRPELRFRLKADDLTRNLGLQRALLEAAAPLVMPGGRLIYATCSLEDAENRDQVAAFLLHHPEYRALSGIAGEAGRCFQVRAGQTVRLDSHGIDGFYFAVLKKSG